MRKIKELTVVEIKEELRTRGEKLSGSRAILVKRLQGARTGKNLIHDEASDTDVDGKDEEEDDGDDDDDDDDEEKLKDSSFINDKEELVDTDDEKSVRYM